MATNDNNDLEARIARLEEQLVPADEMTPEQKAEADKQAAEQQQEFEAEAKKRADEIEASRKKEEEERAALEEKLRAEVDQRNQENGANEELVEPEPDPLPEPPPLHNEDENIHNADPKVKFDEDVVEVTAVVDRHGNALELAQVPDLEPSPELARVMEPEE